MKKLINKIGHFLIYHTRNTTPVNQEKKQTLKKWWNVDGDQTLRLSYDFLSENSIVFDLGGYRGQWASDIFAKYTSHIYVFEPFPEFHDGIVERFAKNKKIKSFPYALGKGNYTSKLFYSDNGTSEFHRDDDKIATSIQVKDFKQFLIDQNIAKIDLIKINIEGGEYDLLDYLLDNGLISKIENIQVQFHDKYVNEPERRMNTIQEKLKVTHHLTWQYKFIWENWERNK